MYFIRQGGVNGLGKNGGDLPPGKSNPSPSPAILSAAQAQQFNRAAAVAPAMSSHLAAQLSTLGVTPQRGSELRAAAGDGVGLPGAELDPVCGCATNKVVESAIAGCSDPDAIMAERDNLYAICMTDPSGFLAQTKELGTAGCKPWYSRRSTWLIGGGILAAGAAFALLR